MNPERFSIRPVFFPADSNSGLGNSEAAQSKRPNSTIIALEKSYREKSVDLREFINNAYIDQSKSMAVIAAEMGISSSSVSKFLHYYEIPIRQRFGQGFEQRRVAGLRRHWNDPDKKDAHLKAIHSPKAKKRRARSVQKFFEMFPEAASIRDSEFRKMIRNRSAERIDRVRIALGGDDLKTTLLELRRDGMTVEQIAEKAGVHQSTLTRLVKNFGLEIVRTKPKRHTKLFERDELRKDIVAQAKVKGTFAMLADRQRQVLDRRYGGGEIPTLDEVAKEFGIRKQGVWQSEVGGFKRLRMVFRWGSEN